MVKNLRGGNISLLDDELLVQILCRLGASKYAAQCKLVCKFWCSAMDTSSSDSHFLCRWRELNDKEEGKLPPVFVTQCAYVHETGPEYQYRHSIDCNSEELPSPDLNFMPSDGPICILSSSKDLLLCCPYPYDHTLYYLCNPFTKQWTILPPPPSAQQVGEVWKTDDIKVGFIVHDHDLGRDIKFTVLRIVPYKFERYNKVHIFVFSSDDGGGGWRLIMDGERASGWTRMFLVHYKGMLLSFRYDAFGYKDERIGFKLDAAGGSPTRFDFPPNQNPDPQLRFRAVIGVCGGVLRLAELVRIPLMLVVWELHDDGERQEWDMVHELEINEMVGGLEDGDMVRCYPAHEPWKVELAQEPWKVEVCVPAFHPHDGDILYLSFCLPQRKNGPMYIFSCDLKKSKLELIRAFTTTNIEHDMEHHWPEPGIFSLVPPCWPTPVPRLQP